MNAWTEENTEGFSRDELATINAVRATLLQGFTGDEKSIDNAITNAWQPRMGRDELARETIHRLIGN